MRDLRYVFFIKDIAKITLYVIIYDEIRSTVDFTDLLAFLVVLSYLIETYFLFYVYFMAFIVYHILSL